MTFKLQPNIISEFLGKHILTTPYFALDNWIFVHFFAGVLLGLFIDKWYIVLALLVLYEIFEIILWGILFQVEPITNIIFDIMFGMLGFFVIWVVKHYFF